MNAKYRGVCRGITAILLVALSPGIAAQRAFEKDGRVVYEDHKGNPTDLGVGFSPVLTQQGEIVLIRGRLFDYGEPFDCSRKETKNWIAAYDPATRVEKTLFDRALSFGRDDMLFCVFTGMQLSPDGSTLYLVSAVYATTGSLAIVRLDQGTVAYVLGVDDIYVIVNGPHRGELIYQQRIEGHIPPLRKGGESPYYPFVHARADGKPIRVLAEEFAKIGVGGTPKLAGYLRSIRGQIIVNGRAFPE